MSAVITVEPCGCCLGRPVEVLAEMIRGEWRPIRGIPSGFDRFTWAECRDGLARDFPGIFRWQDAPCPECHGRGSYEVEHVPCKIF